MTELVLENPLFTKVFDEIKTIVDYTHVSIFFQEGNEVSLIAYRGPMTFEQASIINFDLAESAIFLWISKHNMQLLMSDTLGATPIARMHQTNIKNIPGKPLWYIGSWIGFPICIGDQHSIFLDIAHSERGYYKEKDVLPLERYIKGVAAPIENAVLSAILIRHSTKFQALSAIQHAIFCHMDIPEVLQLIADQALHLTSAQKIYIFMLEEETLSALYESGEDDRGAQTVVKLPFYDSLIGETIRSGQPLRVIEKSDNLCTHPDEALLLNGRPFLIVPLKAHHCPFGALVAIDKKFWSFSPEDERNLVMVAAGAAIALENARLYQEEQEKRRLAEGMQHILAQLSSSQPLKETLNAILRNAIQLLEADEGIIYRKLPADKQMTKIASSDMDEGLQEILQRPFPLQPHTETSNQGTRLHELSISVDGTPATRSKIPLYQESRFPIVVSNFDGWEERATTQPLSEEQQTPDIYLGEVFKTALRVSLGFSSEVLGLIDIFWRQPHSVSANELKIAEEIARYATVTIERDQLSRKSKELTRLQERQRIAQMLHDTVVQILFRIGLEAKWCYQNMEVDHEGKERIQTIQRLVERSNHELRSAIFALRNFDFGGDSDFVDLLNDQLNEFQKEFKIETTLVISPGFGSIPSSIAGAIYRVLREGLVNTRKHASASAVLVSLNCDDRFASITIQDNGVGLPQDPSDESSVNELHFGINTLRQHVASLGGDLFIGNNDDRGTILKASFPLQYGDANETD
jgi:signal transduction histidine kinase